MEGKRPDDNNTDCCVVLNGPVFSVVYTTPDIRDHIGSMTLDDIYNEDVYI